MTLEKIIEEAKIFTIVNGKETFAFEREMNIFSVILKLLIPISTNVTKRLELFAISIKTVSQEKSILFALVKFHFIKAHARAFLFTLKLYHFKALKR